MSSPGSTAPSATTPAVHELSANTSPDHDGQHFVNVAVGKKDDEDTEKEIKDVRSAIPADEDQLLQESIRSSAAASGSEDESRPTQVPNANSLPTPTSTTRKVSADEATESIEVADSQEELTDPMDIDITAKPAGSTSLPQQNSGTPGQVSKDSTVVPERAVTRVSSGAMRLKSVTEIVGGPRSGSNSERGTSTKGPDDQLTPSASAPHSPSSKSRQDAQSRSDKLRNQVSTVLFGKPPKRVDDRSVAQGQKDAFHPFDDYYTPLFIQNFTGATNWMQPMEKVLFHANKTVGTTDANLAIQDHQACKVLRRVYHLQQHDKWSLRQPKRCPEPSRPTSQWDVLLQEMKWMRTDFKEERKWKMALARNMAYACAQWCEANAEERKALQVPAVIPRKPTSTDEDVKMDDAQDEVADNQHTPELVPSGDNESLHNEDELAEVAVETVAPSAIFSLQDDDVVFGLKRTPASDELLDELPLYGAPLKVPSLDSTDNEFDPDALWKRAALPLSKFVEGDMKIVTRGPPTRRGRFDHENEESDDEGDVTFSSNDLVMDAQLPPAEQEVALFNPESKPIRDRLHAGHQFRPPSEHQMPLQSFYECRSSSQWTVSEDSELKTLVREFSYNWSLISNMLATKSSFQSGAERRTPWECFERWISLEGLPADMQRTAYFKAYSNRIDAAQRVIMQQNQRAMEQAQQANASGNAVTPVRRRPSTPVRVERRRNQKHLTLIDAMRKLAKKRETTIQKQQHNAAQNAIKKTNEPVAQRPTKTPRDYSLLRWERDQAVAEKMAQYAQRQEAQRRAAIQARAAQGQQVGQGQTPGANGQVPQNAAQANGNGANGVANGGAQRPAVPNQLAAAAAAAAAAGRRMPMQQGAGNGAGTPGQANNNAMLAAAQMKGIPQAQIQAALQGQQRMAMGNQQPDANLMLRAQRISEQQRAAVQMQQAQQHPQQMQNPAQQGGAGQQGQQSQQGSPPLRTAVNGMNQQNFMNNAQAMLAAFNNNNSGNTNNNNNGQNGAAHGSPQANGVGMPNGTPNGAAVGPRMPTQLPASIAAQLNQLETQLKAKHPNLTPEQARALATEQLTRAMLAQRQSAMNAAAGGAGQTGLPNGIAATTSPHQYAALLRQQQQQQQAQQAAQRQAQQKASQSPAPQQTQQQKLQASRATSSASPAPQQVQQAQQQRQASGSATPTASSDK